MHGFALCRQLRADAATRRVAIVIVAGDGARQERPAIDAGCDAVLAKPCSRTLRSPLFAGSSIDVELSRDLQIRRLAAVAVP
jgi:CheY-like chemotaxis protein